MIKNQNTTSKALFCNIGHIDTTVSIIIKYIQFIIIDTTVQCILSMKNYTILSIIY